MPVWGRHDGNSLAILTCNDILLKYVTQVHLLSDALSFSQVQSLMQHTAMHADLMLHACHLSMIEQALKLWSTLQSTCGPGWHQSEMLLASLQIFCLLCLLT